VYYARTVDHTVLMPLNDIATEQTKATEKTQAATNQILDYLATHPDATNRNRASDMILHIHSDASCLSVYNARSRLGGLLFLGSRSLEQDTFNGSILNVEAVFKNVVASTAESEAGACFHNAQSGAPFRVTLTELGHTQTPTPLRTDSSTVFGIVNKTIKQKRSKEMDMRYHWLTDRVRQTQFDVYWRPGRENLGDYHTKHHSAQHQKDMHHLILHEANSLQVLRGCVKLLPLPHSPVRTRADARTNPSAQRATQLRSVLVRVFTLSQDRTKLLLLSHNFSNVMLNSTIPNEVHYCVFRCNAIEWHYDGWAHHSCIVQSVSSGVSSLVAYWALPPYTGVTFLEGLCCKCLGVSC
jgi:hypothetical protein